MSKDKANILLPVDYADWISSLKKRIAGARQRIVLSANEEQIRLYHDIGRDILDRQNRQLKYMRFFVQECPDIKIGQQPADQLPWFHIVAITKNLPKEYCSSLPNIEEIEAELRGENGV